MREFKRKRSNNEKKIQKKIAKAIFKKGDIDKCPVPFSLVWVLLQDPKIKYILKKLSEDAKQPGSNRGKNNIIYITFCFFILLSGCSSPEQLINSIGSNILKEYNIDVSKSAFYKWIERVAQNPEPFEKALEETGLLSLKKRKGLIIDTDACYHKTTASWAKFCYKGFQSYRTLVVHASNYDTGQKAIMKCITDNGNTYAGNNIYEILDHMTENYNVILFRSDSAAYQANIINLAQERKTNFIIGGDLDSSAAGSIGMIKKYEKFYDKNGFETVAEIGYGVHSMQKTEKGFWIINKRIPLKSEEGIQGVIFPVTNYKNLPITTNIQPKNKSEKDINMKFKTTEEIRRSYENRCGEEYLFGRFNTSFNPIGKESLEKTHVWNQLMAMAFNIMLYFSEIYSRQKNVEPVMHFRFISSIIFAQLKGNTKTVLLVTSHSKTALKIFEKLWKVAGLRY